MTDRISSATAPGQPQPQPRGNGVFVVPSAALATGTPKVMPFAGRRLTRFMDSIYLDRPSEKLTPVQIQTLNLARRPLMDLSEVGSVNARVRAALAFAVRESGARNVLEWGCGYHSMRSQLGLSWRHYGCVDVDNKVVAFQKGWRRFGAAVYHADSGLDRISTARYNAVVSAFVFHFRISRLHISTMRRVLAPDGFILANVYRRSPQSRRELAGMFKEVGFQVVRERDAAQLCSAHEFWCIGDASLDQHRLDGVLELVRRQTSSVS